jgi:cystathionine gamma-synthase
MENATVLAARLTNHARVESVRHFGAMVSFIVHGGAGAADAAIDRLTLVVAATSLGGVETTMERRQKYAGDAHVAPGLIRMSVGIEHVEDIWADLAQALDSLR